MISNEELSVHDNRLISYEVLCARRQIVLHTEFRDRGEPFEFTDVIFNGVAAYDFFHDSDMGTIIFDIPEIAPMNIYLAHADQFLEGKRHGWPGEWARSAELAAEYFEQNHVKGFELDSSCGMSGWVLAQDMQKRPRSEE
jgi:hypothetical protein